MKVFRTHLISLFLLSVVISCSDPCDYERLEYIGNSIDVVDNSGLKPVSLTGNTIKSKVFGIFYQLQFENKKNPDACAEYSSNIPTSLKIYTKNRFNYNLFAGSEITNSFKILNSGTSYPVSLQDAKLKTNNHLFLYLDPSIDTIQQFIINGYNNGLLISSDTTRPILLRR